MEYEVQYARITTTGKLPDRFLNCQSRSSMDISKAYMGTFYSLIEINSPWFATSQVGQSIINTFYQAYYSGDSTSDLDNFESALKAVNENLTKITQNGETNWIGNLNAILAIQIENRIILAQTGTAEAYIFRQGKVNHLTYGLAQDQTEVHPANTFSNVTSGELKVHDKVLIANPDLFVNLELDTLKEIISINSPRQAVLQIAKILKKKKVRAVNVMILDLMTLEQASKVLEDNLSDNIHLDRPIESAFVGFEKVWQQILSPLFSFLGKLLASAFGKLFTFTVKSIKNMKQKQAAKPAKMDQFHKDFIQDSGKDEGLLKDEEIQYSPELHVHHYEMEKKKKIAGDKYKIVKLIWQKVMNFVHWLILLWHSKKNRPYLLGALGLIVVVIIIFAISAGKGSGKKMTLLEAQTILKTVQAAQKDGKNYSSIGDSERAKISFNNCVLGAQKISSIEILKQDSQAAGQSCQTELDRLTNTTRYASLQPIMSGVTGVKNVFNIAGQNYLVTANEIYRVGAGTAKPEKVASLPRNNGDILYGVASSEIIFLYTSSQNVYEYSIVNDTFEQAKINGTWEKATGLSYYNGNFYLLDGVNGQVYKHVLSSQGFAAGQNYLNAGFATIKNGISFAVDGSVYVLRSTGDVVKLQGGKVQDFIIRDLPTPNSKIEKPVKLYTDSDTSSIFILDAGQNRIIEFDKDGHFIHQYAMPDGFGTITDFDVSTKTKKLWLVSQNNLYELSL